MRVLTPEEINELTTRYCGEKRVSLTSLMKNTDESNPLADTSEAASENLAKILPFKSTEDNQVRDHHEKSELVAEIEMFAGDQVKELFGSLYGVKSNSMASVVHSEQVDQVIEIKQKKSASIFILEEKEKLECNQRKLKSTEILKSYKKVSGVDLEVERGHQDDLFWSSSQGLLINKKQA